MNDDQSPTSIEEVEALIKQLYEVRVPGDVGKIQKALYGIQLSSKGWELANTLLNRREEHVKFFGALTFIVKLNTDAKSLSENDAQLVLITIIDFLIKWIDSGEGPLVGRKLCSALVTYFLQFPSSWSNCLRHLFYCFSSNKALPYSAFENTLEPGILIQALSDKKAKVIFWFASNLVEDLSKTDSSSMKANDFHRYVRPNIDDIVPLIGKYLLHDPRKEVIEIQHAALICFQSWVSFSHRSFIDKEADLEALKLLTEPALRCITNNDLYEISAEIFTDILSSYSRFLKPEDFINLHNLFKTSWAQKKYEALVGGDYDWDSLQFGQLLLTMGDAIQRELTQNIDNPLSAHYLTLFLGLLNAKGYAVAEDKIYVSALEFWSTFVEMMVDDSFSAEPGSSPQWFAMAQRYVMQAIEYSWRKSQYPPSQELNTWDPVDSMGFNDARRDLSDLIQQFFLVSRSALLQFLVEKISYSASTRNWNELEISFYCLAQLSDIIIETKNRDDVLNLVFTQDLIDLIADPQIEIPTRARRAYLNLIIGYANYFGKKPEQLPNVLNLSFVALGSSSLANQASRAVMKLCSSCRQTLLPNLNLFLQNYSNIAQNSTLDFDAKELVIEGIACLIQAMDDEASKIEPLNQLLGYIEFDAGRCLDLLNSKPPIIEINDTSTVTPENEARAVDLGILTLKCLLGIAKGLQVPDDQSIDLDSEDDTVSSVWRSEKGICVQQKIYNIIYQVYNAFLHRGDIIEVCCLIWRQGLRELEPGPFVLSPYLVAGLMMKADLETPRLGLIIKSATYLTSSKFTSEYQEILVSLLAWITTLLQKLGDPAVDSEISQAAIEFMHRLIPRNINILLSDNLPKSLDLFMFALRAIQGVEPLPRSAAAEFWLSVPIRKLTTCHVNAKKWFEAALLHHNFPSDKVGLKEKKTFVEKVFNLRGARLTNQVIKEFWLACRGSHFSYAS
ncbi:Importin beta-like protein kap111 [Erysiphe neolycopersici]|uniref:Importin beta-like protein kap111 n=1 Tax=Erysiphe neolycopersici TaxID=212602 RepID=A0A420HGT6_9PEZI|nr:Importin beta-like protein kap111 [Erysiphe neolycopersici]